MSAIRKILIIDDSVFLINLLIDMLSLKYEVISALNGKDGIKLAKKLKPDLILLDIFMIGMNGYEVCVQLKKDIDVTDIPVVFISGATETMNEVKAFESGGADFVTKPFIPKVILARIEHHIKMSESLLEFKNLYNITLKSAMDANPITGLPGNNSIKKRIEKAIIEKQKYFVFYADLDNFKSYNDKYGFAYGDKVILFTSNLFHSVAKKIKCNDIFVGHIGGDDFVLLVPKKFGIEFIEMYLNEFDMQIIEYYDMEDQKQGYIISKNRRGEVVKHHIMSISVAGVDLSKEIYKGYLQVNDSCAEIKHKVKSIKGSTYLIDRRQS